MTRFKELSRIQAAIRHRNESELRWADDYCRMRVEIATLNKHKSYWKRIQRDVDHALRGLSVTEDHIGLTIATQPFAPSALRANISETLSVPIINEQSEEEKIRDEQEFCWCCVSEGRGWRGTKRRRA
jgi:hypothetical protein